jgi:hypothetical protein
VPALRWLHPRHAWCWALHQLFHGDYTRAGHQHIGPAKELLHVRRTRILTQPRAEIFSPRHSTVEDFTVAASSSGTHSSGHGQMRGLPHSFHLANIAMYPPRHCPPPRPRKHTPSRGTAGRQINNRRIMSMVIDQVQLALSRPERRSKPLTRLSLAEIQWQPRDTTRTRRVDDWLPFARSQSDPLGPTNKTTEL